MQNKITPYIGITLTSEEMRLDIQFSNTCITLYLDENCISNICACICLEDNSILNRYDTTITCEDLMSVSRTDSESISYYIRHKLIVLCETYINYEQQLTQGINLDYKVINDICNSLKTQLYLSEISTVYQDVISTTGYNAYINTSMMGANTYVGVTT